LSSDNGRRGAALRKGEMRKRFGAGGAEQEQGESSRSIDGRAIGTGGRRSKWIGEEDCGGMRWWEDRINPIAPPSSPFKYLVETLATAG
jgi:hypothetical protein